MKKFLALLLLVVLTACSSTPLPTRWTLTHKVMTEAERERIDAHVRDVLSHIPQNISGHDQDLDDYARMVYYESTKALTPPRMFEEVNVSPGRFDTDNWRETGRWRDCTYEELKAAK